LLPRIALAALVLLTISQAAAQISAPPRPAPQFSNAASFGFSYGVQDERDATFWGWSLEYSRQLRGHWIVAGGLTWDQETEKIEGRPDKEIRTFTAVTTITRTLTDWFSLTLGLGKGFADTDNPAASMRIADGDWSSGLVFGFATPGLPQYSRDSIVFSVAYEYNFDQLETSYSLDVTFGWSF